MNFTEPPMTSSKIYFKTSDDEEDETVNKIRINKNKNTGKLRTSLRKLNFYVSLKRDPVTSVEHACSSIANFDVAKAPPIYPGLIDCNENVQEVLSIIHRNDLLENFHLIHVKTVGDLAKLNAEQVNKLEFLNEPKLEPIVAALDVISKKQNHFLTEMNTFAQPSDGDDRTNFFTNLHKAITNANLESSRPEGITMKNDGDVIHTDQTGTAATDVLDFCKLQNEPAVGSKITKSGKVHVCINATT